MRKAWRAHSSFAGLPQNMEYPPRMCWDTDLLQVTKELPTALINFSAMQRRTPLRNGSTRTLRALWDGRSPEETANIWPSRTRAGPCNDPTGPGLRCGSPDCEVTCRALIKTSGHRRTRPRFH